MEEWLESIGLQHLTGLLIFGELNRETLAHLGDLGKAQIMQELDGIGVEPQHRTKLAREIIKKAEEEAAEIEDEAYEEGGADDILAYTPPAAVAPGADAWAHVPVAPGAADADEMSSSSMPSQVSTANSTSTQRAEQASIDSDTPLICPQDPVTAANGRNYERAAIEGHFATGRHSSPMTGAPLPSLKLVPNRELQRRCQALSRKQEAQRAGRAQRDAPSGGGGR